MNVAFCEYIEHPTEKADSLSDFLPLHYIHFLLFAGL